MTLAHDLIARGLHLLDPEDAHRATIAGLALGLGPRAPAHHPMLATEIAGISLPNCIGLAPGFDKNAEVFGPMLASGFGFVECGTVTPLPQAGNPRPRLFRLTPDQAVINRMGFNNEGLEAFAARLARRGAGVVGANIGANKEAEDRIADYVTGLERLWGMADYFTVNISSPNTPGLRGCRPGRLLRSCWAAWPKSATACRPRAGFRFFSRWRRISRPTRSRPLSRPLSPRVLRA